MAVFSGELLGVYRGVGLLVSDRRRLCQVKEAEKRWGGRAEELSWKLEKTRLQESLREKNDEIDRLEKSKLAQKKDIEDIRKEVSAPTNHVQLLKRTGKL